MLAQRGKIKKKNYVPKRYFYLAFEYVSSQGSPPAGYMVRQEARALGA